MSWVLHPEVRPHSRSADSEGRTRAWLAVHAALIDFYEAVGAWLSRKSREEGWDPSHVDALSRVLVSQNWGVLSVKQLLLLKESLTGIII